MFSFMQNALIGGDYNADYSYLSPSEWRSLDMVVDKQFTWLIRTQIPLLVQKIVRMTGKIL